MKTKQFFPISLLLCLSLILFRCEEETLVVGPDNQVDDVLAAKGGGHTETTGNNLSFPALCADGFAIAPIAATSFLVEYIGPYTGLTSDQLSFVLANGPWYAQKVAGNVWQAEYSTVSAVDVSFIDWGDAIESVDPKLGRPYRLELALYSDDGGMMDAYTMAELAFPSSPQETQGTNTVVYESEYATVASPKGFLVVQRFADVEDLTWNADLGQWDGAFTPETITFQQELNVGGRLIYGASTGGWKPTIPGNYRITFYMGSTSVVNLMTAIIADKSAPTIPKVAENNQPFVDETYNLTYVDVQVTSGGGSGGKGPR